LLKRYLEAFSSASVSPVASFAFRFLRTIILSRLLTPEHVGACVALYTILSSCELITTVGLDSFVFVHVGEDRAQALAAAQQIAFLRGLLLGAAILLFAPALADLFGASAHSVVWLSVVPPIFSLRNLSVVQIQQEFRYLPETISNVGGQVGAVIAAVLAAVWFRDERAMLASLMVEALVNVPLSYWLAPRRRVAAVDPMMRRAALTFGFPLLLNGIALMVLGVLDRVIVVNLFDLAALAKYSLAANLVIAPASILIGILGKLGMPLVARSRADQGASNSASLIVLLAVLLVGAAYAVPVALFLDRLVPLVYGAQYQVTPAFSALMGCVAFLRICRSGPNNILLIHSETARLTAGNTISSAGVLIGFLLAMRYRELEAILAGLAIGDALSLALLSALTSRHVRLRSAFRLHAPVAALTVGLVALARLAEGGLGTTLGLQLLLLVAATLAIGLQAVAVHYKFVTKLSRL
jgi:O-antigen/teichoic acid export membrane protein